MSDQETRLRDGMQSAVADEAVPVGLLQAVYRRHRRRTAAIIATAAVTVGLIVAAAVSAAQLAGDGRRPIAPASFPGGGRLLFAHGNALSWLYPDGRQVLVARGFTDASIQGQSLVAQKEIGRHAAYYAMRLDGSAQKLLVPAERARGRDVFRPLISPDGTSVAYLLQIVRPHATQFRLQVRDLESGRVTDLGQINGSFWWQSPTRLVAGAADARSLVAIDAATGTRTTYLSVTDPQIAAAYSSARPSAGPASFISADGWSDGPGRGPLAVSVASSTQNTRFSKPVELLYDGRSVTQIYAPATPQQLDASWGPHGLLLFATGAGDIPGWDTYVATSSSGSLSKPLPFGQTGITSNPAGTVIAMQDDNDIAFAPVPAPACEAVGRCAHFQPKFLSGRGQLLGWLP